MCRCTSDENLGQKKKDRYGEKFNSCPLAFRRRSRQELRMDVLSRSLPPEKIEFAENKQNGRGSGQQHHEAQGAPEIGAGCRPVADCRIIGEVGGIGVIFSRTIGYGRPGRPGKEGCQLSDLFRVMNKPYQKPPIDGGIVEVGGPFPDLILVGCRFRCREEQENPYRDDSGLS